MWKKTRMEWFERIALKHEVKSLSRVRLYATPQMAAHQAPPSLGFSRKEHWNGLPFPSPMHESEKWKWSRSVVSDSSRPRGLQPTRLLPPWDFPGKSTGVGCHCLLQLYIKPQLKIIMAFPHTYTQLFFFSWPCHEAVGILVPWPSRPCTPCSGSMES